MHADGRAYCVHLSWVMGFCEMNKYPLESSKCGFIVATTQVCTEIYQP